MDVRKLSLVLIALGVAALFAALIWWFNFWGDVARQLNRNVFDALDCLFLTGGKCGEVTAVASWAGKTPYTPIVFWVGATLTAVGVIIHFSIGKRAD